MTLLNVKVVFVLGVLYGASRLLVDQLSQLAFPHCDHPTKCFDYEEELAASIHPEADPCDNLYDHVCAKWDRLHPQDHPSTWGQIRLLQGRVLSFLLGKLQQSPSEQPILAMQRTVSGFQSCLKVYAERRDDTKVAPFALGRFAIDSLELHRNINHTNNTWNAVKKATRENFAKLSWMDKSTAKGAIEHVDSLITVLPLPQHLQTNEALQAHYGFLDPNVSQPFIQWLFKTKQRRLEEQKRLFKESTVTIYHDDFDYSAFTVNAFYVPLMHIMAILPAIMAAPFVPQEVPATIHYGAMGKVLGHELTHAFDPLFSNLTRTGEVGTWWSKQSFDSFRGRLECLRRQLDSYTENEVHSKNALSETFADTAGTAKARLAFTSLPAGKGVLGYTQEQSFFIAGCFAFCSEGGYDWKEHDKYPAMVLRCNIPALNEKKFATAFNCPKGSAMNPEKRCTFH